MPYLFLRRLLILTLIVGNVHTIKNAWLGIILAGLFLWLYGRILGKLLFPKMDSFFQTLFGTLSLSGFNSIILWIGFYLYGINELTFTIAIAATTAAVEFWHYKSFRSDFQLPNVKLLAGLKTFLLDLKPKTAIIIYLSLAATTFFQLFAVRSDQVVASPWNILPDSFWGLFITASMVLFLIVYKNRTHKFSLFLIILHFFIFSSVAFFVYKIGYGYDPFLHLAAMKEIIAKGFILPKTPYYVGEYSLILFFYNLTHLPLDFLNRIFLPLSFALYFPTAAYYALTNGLKLEKKYSLLAIFSGLILPANYFINTTPQGLTNLVALIIIFLSFLKEELSPNYFLFFLSILAFTIHPLYGLPLFLFVLFRQLPCLTARRTAKVIFQVLTICSSLIIFPALFIANSLVNDFMVNIHQPTVTDFSHLIAFNLKKYFLLVPEISFNYGANIKLIFLFCALAGIILLWHRRELKRYAVYLFSSAILFVNYLLTKTALNFNFATNQNREQYLSRISELSLYLLLPTVLVLTYYFIKNNFETEKNFTGKIFVVTILSLTSVLSFYFSYPIKNNFHDSQEYNVTATDIETVRWISKNAPGDYIVLGNQMLAAAAIREFGFSRYYNGQFYYSIPNGQKDNLYQYYEKMVFDRPDKKFVQEASRLAGVKGAYFVISDYWSNSDKIISVAKQTANGWQDIQQGKATIFYYSQ